MPKKPKANRFVISDPIFDTDYLIQIGGSPNDAIKELAKLLDVEPWHMEENPYRRGHFVAYEPYPQGCLWFHESAWAGLVAHECLHAVAYTMRRLQIPLNDDTEEVYTYYQQWMLNEILPKMQVWKGYAEFVGKKGKK